jgi:hypothetical protein
VAPAPLTLTEPALNRATLGRQMLLERARIGVVEAVHRVVALQAQEPASPYLALRARVSGFDPEELDRAFADHAVVKATLMRVTLHAVDAADYPAFHEAMQPTLRAARLHDRRFRATGLTPDAADALLPDVLAFAAEPRSNAEADAWFEGRIGPVPKPGAWWAFRQYGPFVHHPSGGPWSFGLRPSYVAARDQGRLGDLEAAMRRLVARYLEGFGPASIEDFGQFAMLSRPLVRGAFASLLADGAIRRLHGPNGRELFDLPDGLLPDADSPAPPRLLPMWDSTLLAYADRGRIIPPDYRRLVTRSNGDVLPTILVDGLVAGVWRTVDGGVEVSAFRSLDDDGWAGLEAEAGDLIALLARREPSPYRRYGRWYAELPAAEVRVLAG